MSANPESNLGRTDAQDYLHSGNHLVAFRQTMGKLGRIGVNDLVPNRKLWSIQAHRYDQKEEEGGPGIMISLRYHDFTPIGIYWETQSWAISAFEAYIERLSKEESYSSANLKVEEDWYKGGRKYPKEPIFLRTAFTYYLPGPILGQIVLAEYDTRYDQKALVTLAHNTYFIASPAIPGLTFPLPNLKKEERRWELLPR